MGRMTAATRGTVAGKGRAVLSCRVAIARNGWILGEGFLIGWTGEAMKSLSVLIRC